MELTSNERDRLLSIARKLADVQDCMSSQPLQEQSTDCAYWYERLAPIKRRLGNFANDVSFTAGLMAKAFVMSRHLVAALDIASKPQGAPGLDLDVMTTDGRRVIGQIKTTIPYHGEDLGAQQRKTFVADFAKLATNQADYRYFFVTEREAFDVVRKRYLADLVGVTLVLLPQALQAGHADAWVVVASAREATTMPHTHARPEAGAGGKSLEPSLADSIRRFIRDQVIIPARKAGRIQIQIRSGVVHNLTGLSNRYPAVCSVMRGRKIEELCGVTIARQEGHVGAYLHVTYSL